MNQNLNQGEGEETYQELFDSAQNQNFEQIPLAQTNNIEFEEPNQLEGVENKNALTNCHGSLIPHQSQNSGQIGNFQQQMDLLVIDSNENNNAILYLDFQNESAFFKDQQEDNLSDGHFFQQDSQKDNLLMNQNFEKQINEDWNQFSFNLNLNLTIQMANLEINYQNEVIIKQSQVKFRYIEILFPNIELLKVSYQNELNEENEINRLIENPQEITPQDWQFLTDEEQISKYQIEVVEFQKNAKKYISKKSQEKDTKKQKLKWIFNYNSWLENQHKKIIGDPSKNEFHSNYQKLIEILIKIDKSVINQDRLNQFKEEPCFALAGLLTILYIIPCDDIDQLFRFLEIVKDIIIQTQQNDRRMRYENFCQEKEYVKIIETLQKDFIQKQDKQHFNIDINKHLNQMTDKTLFYILSYLLFYDWCCRIDLKNKKYNYIQKQLQELKQLMNDYQYDQGENYFNQKLNNYQKYGFLQLIQIIINFSFMINQQDRNKHSKLFHSILLNLSFVKIDKLTIKQTFNFKEISAIILSLFDETFQMDDQIILENLRKDHFLSSFLKYCILKVNHPVSEKDLNKYIILKSMENTAQVEIQLKLQKNYLNFQVIQIIEYIAIIEYQDEENYFKKQFCNYISYLYQQYYNDSQELQNELNSYQDVFYQNADMNLQTLLNEFTQYKHGQMIDDIYKEIIQFKKENKKVKQIKNDLEEEQIPNKKIKKEK
ncbi:unnamed protein product [Paramecium sonneborni]|uniref:Uncharacterized protein n=1 Tax=Paramecium sonneborni TaxID=65129 RepID=A0A8S1QJ89_9CILI|nr:unnamed protein product [Paramecium sonneborni]